MKGSKIMVLKMSEIIKALIFAGIGIIIIILLVVLFSSRSGSDEHEHEQELEQTQSHFTPGTYYSVIPLRDVGDISVSIIVSEDEILDIILNDFSETHQAFYPLITEAMEVLRDGILENQSTDNIEISEEKVFTKQVLLNAVNDAIASAVRE
ncbi:MAG: hypothetical protein FWD82_03855 [Defluviitaleaceae bacterium]|nr:hypothetical protein [Defluviitaleaceae bacterium]